MALRAGVGLGRTHAAGVLGAGAPLGVVGRGDE
jgi:hypothetical protein